MKSTLAVGVATALSFVGCGGDSSEVGPASSEIEGRSVSVEPFLQLGGAGAAGPEQFTNVRWVTRLSNGEIVVLEQATAELRFFDETGAHIRTTGRRGQGPGEFSNRALKLARGGGDTLLVLDWPQTGLMFFSPAGQYVRSARVDYMQARMFGASLCPEDVPIPMDGSILGCISPNRPVRTEAPTIAEQQRISRRLVRVLPELESADTLGEVLTPEGYDIGLPGGVIAIVAHPFGSKSFVAADSGRVYIATNPEYEIEVWSLDGRLEHLVTRDGARLEASEELKAQAWAELSEGFEPQNREPIRAVLPVPDSIPAIHGLAVGPNGELWVQREPFMAQHTAAVLDVFNDVGAFIGTVRLPTPLLVKEVGEDYILGVRKDEFDVPIVELYKLTRD